MPSQFRPLRFSLSKAEAELATFKNWFSQHTYLGEKEIVSELRARPQMCALLASVGAIQAPDLIRFELTLQGLFRTDLVVGNNATRRFVLIEFEDAEENSFFLGVPVSIAIGHAGLNTGLVKSSTGRGCVPTHQAQPC